MWASAVAFEHYESSILIGQPTESLKCDEPISANDHETLQAMANPNESNFAAVIDRDPSRRVSNLQGEVLWTLQPSSVEDGEN